MAGWDDRDRFRHHVDTGENLCRLGDARQSFLDQRGIEMFKMQENMIFIFADPTALTNFHGHGAANHVAAG